MVARTAIRAGDLLTEDNIALKRPGTGMSAHQFFDVIGTRADRDYRADEMVQAISVAGNEG